MTYNMCHKGWFHRDSHTYLIATHYETNHCECDVVSYIIIDAFAKWSEVHVVSSASASQTTAGDKLKNICNACMVCRDRGRDALILPAK